MRVFAIGEAPSRRNPDGVPLGSYRRRIGDATVYQHVVELHGVNLFAMPQPAEGKGSKFPLASARERAQDLLPKLRRLRAYDAIWLAGKRVAAAFGLRGVDYFVPVRLDGVRVVVYVVPHPSGVNHFWTDRRKLGAWRQFVERQTT